MSATPRPWKEHTQFHRILLGADERDAPDLDAEDVHVIAEVNAHDDGELILKAVNAFDALVAVAKAAVPVVRDHAQAGPHECDAGDAQDLPQALAALDATHPDWRDWKVGNTR
jgi:hypothetical protein